ncbi:MAG: hypothetical protein ACREGF_00205, partial [Candidatus Saccharimonadales bacterium]
NELEPNDQSSAGENPGSAAKRPERNKPTNQAYIHVPLSLSTAEKLSAAEAKPIALPLHEAMDEEREIPLHPAPEPTNKMPKSRRRKSSFAVKTAASPANTRIKTKQPQPVRPLPNQTELNPPDSKSDWPAELEQTEFRAEPPEIATPSPPPAAELELPKEAPPGLQFYVEPEDNMPLPTINSSPDTSEPQWQVDQSWPDPEWMQAGGSPPESPFSGGQPTDYIPELAEIKHTSPPADSLQNSPTEYSPNPFERSENSAKPPRIEYSAWHRIEVDPRTGRPLENPELAYGQEFLREQKPEALVENQTARPYQNDKDEELASASGQLAVGHSPAITLPSLNSEEAQPQPDKAKAHSKPPQDSGGFRQSLSPLADFNTDDLLLWSGVILVFLAIILAIVL